MCTGGLNCGRISPKRPYSVGYSGMPFPVSPPLHSVGRRSLADPWVGLFELLERLTAPSYLPSILSALPPAFLRERGEETVGNKRKRERGEPDGASRRFLTQGYLDHRCLRDHDDH